MQYTFRTSTNYWHLHCVKTTILPDGCNMLMKLLRVVSSHLELLLLLMMMMVGVRTPDWFASGLQCRLHCVASLRSAKT